MFVAKLLGTPPINVFDGTVKGGKLYLGDNAVLDTPDVEDQNVYVGIRPEGFVIDPLGGLCCDLKNVEVMGRDITVVSTHPACENIAIRSIISAENKIDVTDSKVRFSLKKNKVFLFCKDTQDRI